MRGGLGGRLGAGSGRSTTAAAVREQNRCQVEPTILFACPAKIPRSSLRSFSLWARHSAETSAELNVRLGAAEFLVKRHLVGKRWTIEKADEKSNGIPWFVLHRPNSDKLRFHIPSLPWHWFDA